jgi:hypothetical protein
VLKDGSSALYSVEAIAGVACAEAQPAGSPERAAACASGDFCREVI